MSSGFTDYSQPPLSYTTPPFPSLYWPFDTDPGEAQYLYSLTDIWMFTVYWTLITVPSAHFLVAAWGVLMQFSTATRRKRYLKSFDEHGYEIPTMQRSGGQFALPKWFKVPWAKGTDRHKGRGKGKGSRRRTRTKSDQQVEFPVIEAVQDLHLDTLQPEGRKSDEASPADSESVDREPKLFAVRTHRPRMLSAKNRKLYGEFPINETLTWVWAIPLIYLVLGGLEAVLGGSVVGLVLGAVYNAGYFRMSTWTPLVWGIINVLVLILGSFRIQGGL